MIRRWVTLQKGDKTHNKRIIPLLGISHISKHLDFSTNYVNNWGLIPGKYLLINYDEKWFWGMVMKQSAKDCDAIGLDPFSYKEYHISHINKVMKIIVTGISLIYSLENRG